MKLALVSLPIAVAALTCSCQSIPSASNVISENAGGAASLSPLKKCTPCELKEGMCKDEILSALGKPSYQYALAGEETWVYEDCNFIVDKARDTALNMVPFVGPAASLYFDMKADTVCAKAAVTFDCEGKVICFSQAESGK